MAQGTSHGAASIRLEHDSMGWIEVPGQALWGAQTQRSLVYFQISTERMPHALLMAVVRIKKAAALVNEQLGLLDQGKAQAIAQAAQEVLQGEHGDAFPLSLWQTGSGTQSHMNVNEVLANRASELMGAGRGAARCVDPHDDVNMGQSSNDVFPSAMNMACVGSLIQSLLPALQGLRATLATQSDACAEITKVGRTHLQDATPLTLGQEMSGWVAQLAHAQQAISATVLPLHELAIGGTAVGNGINTHPQFGERVAAHLADELGWPLRCAGNRYAAMAAHDGLVNAHGALKTLAVALMKVANDVRWLASGPRCGLGELHLPENEPGSSIMPGKVNPTQCEALTMVCCQVMGNDVALTMGGAAGNFELNVFKPLILHNFLQSTRLLADAMLSFDMHCARGIAPDLARIDQLLHRSLMNVTALVPHIGHDLAAQVAQYALKHDTALGDAATVVAGITPAQFNEWVQAKKGVP